VRGTQSQDLARALELHRRGDLDQAIATYQEVVRCSPPDATAFYMLGMAHFQRGEPEQAVPFVEKALTLQPDLSGARYNFGVILQALGRNADAVAQYKQALAVDPSDFKAYMNCASSLEMLGRNDEAIQYFDRAVALEPDYAGYVGAKLCLGLGRFAQGWGLFEHRWEGVKGSQPRAYRQPRWDGRNLPGTLLVWGEQGLGDQILHAGMIPEVAERVGRLVLEVAPRLVDLFARSFEGVRVTALGDELHQGPVDAHMPIGSLGRFLRTSWDAFPRRDRGYLVADAARAAALRKRLKRDQRVVVGLSWISNNQRKAKSARLSDFQSLFNLPDCCFVDLQYGDTLAEREAVARELGVHVERLEDIDNMNDIDGLAALITACDAVVSVSNTTAHLAGALGAATWTMIPHGHARIWYWFKDRDESPWYARVHVRFQTDGQPWSDLVASIADELSRDETLK
jgi:Tfp pilus assembly protein PilF